MQAMTCCVHMQAEAGSTVPSLVSAEGSFTAAAGCMLLCTLGSGGSLEQLPTSMQAVLRPVKFPTQSQAAVASGLLTAAGFGSPAVS